MHFLRFSRIQDDGDLAASKTFSYVGICGYARKKLRLNILDLVRKTIYEIKFVEKTHVRRQSGSMLAACDQ